MDMATQELAVYLWENYIEYGNLNIDGPVLANVYRVNDSTNVIFLGVGEAYKAVLHLLNTRNCNHPIKHCYELQLT